MSTVDEKQDPPTEQIRLYVLHHSIISKIIEIVKKYHKNYRNCKEVPYYFKHILLFKKTKARIRHKLDNLDSLLPYYTMYNVSANSV